MQKEFIFHIGLPKTGSTALQTFLANNVLFLQERGISYPFVAAGLEKRAMGCQGNASLQFAKLAEESGKTPSYHNRAKYFFRDLIENALSESLTDKILISAEELSNVEMIEEFEYLAKSHKVRCIAFVRDAYDLTLSSWKEHVKSLGSALTLADLITSIRSGTYQISLTRAAKFAQSNIDVSLVSYDTYRNRIISKFLAEIGIDEPDLDVDYSTTYSHNLSLSLPQANLITLVHQTTGSSFLTSLLLDIYKRNLAPHTDPTIVELDSAILDVFQQDIKDVNTFLSTNDQLRTVPRFGVNQTDLMTSQKEIMLLLSVLAKYKNVGSVLPPNFDGREYLAHNSDVRASGLDPEYHYITHGHSEGRIYQTKTEIVEPDQGALLPPDFNADEYLLHNPDVALEGLDAEYHYLAHGRWEGRVYKWTNKDDR